jgi:hypothetical protein
MRGAWLVGIALCPGSALADDAAWYLQVDNDVVFATDRWYSSGVRLARVQRHEAHAIEVGLLQEVYTPEAKRFSFGTVDRRPAARLLASVARHDLAPGMHQTLGIEAGVRGPAALGEQATDAIHRLIPAPEVDWSREGSNRFDGQVLATRTHAFPGSTLYVHYGAVLGNQLSFAHAGAEYRIGSGCAFDLSSPLMRFAPTPPLAATAAAMEGWSAFVGGSVRGVARNRLLDEGYDSFAPAPELRRGIARVAAGVSGITPWASFAFAIAQDSREFAQQRTPHRFGSLTVHVAF